MNKWVGYCALHRFNTSVIEGHCVIFRAEAGILREYRGRSKTLWFGFFEAMKYRIRHPFCALYYLGSFVHPSVFYMFSRYFKEYYPRPDLPLPNRVKDLLLELATLFHIEPIEGQDILVRQVGWIIRESAEDRDFWQNHTNPAVKFYVRINPRYVSGYGLLSLVPLTFNNIFMSLTRFLTRKLRRLLPR